MKLVIFLLIALSPAAFALTGFLDGQEIRGMNRYCHYSNGTIITVSSISLCPLQVN